MLFCHCRNAGISSRAQKAVEATMKVRSPSKVSEGIGVNFGKGMAQGIAQMNACERKKDEEGTNVQGD